MASLPVARPEEGDKQAAGGQRLAAIVKSVMDTLGRPSDFLRTTVRPVTGNTCRINVVVGADPSAARIAHSYFVTADEDGTVVGSDPAILKCY